MVSCNCVAQRNKTQHEIGGILAKDKKNVTAWLDDEQQRKLDHIINRMGGNPSNSYVLGKLIEQEYERLTGNSDSSLSEREISLIDLMIALVNGDVSANAESALLFLKNSKTKLGEEKR